MYIEFLVEEFSAKVLLEILLPRILSSEYEWKIHHFQGKTDLLKRVPNLLRGYSQWIPPDYRFVVLVDRDRDDCRVLKTQLEDIATNAGFITKARANNKAFQVLNRIVIEELEAWLFGDIEAICTAYPGVPITLTQQARFRNSDEIKGGTCEALEQVLQAAGHHPGGLEKARAAREIAQYMNPKVNKSPSFQTFYSGLLQMLN